MSFPEFPIYGYAPILISSSPYVPAGIGPLFPQLILQEKSRSKTYNSEESQESNSIKNRLPHSSLLAS